MKKKIIIISIIVVSIICLLGIGFGLFLVFNKPNNNIDDNYIALFHGASGEVIYETYIYKIDNKKSNIGFRYVNVTATTESYGSSEWNRKVTKRGKFDFIDGAFIVAKENKAYSYVTVLGDENYYSIDEFKDKFIMN